MAVSEIYRWCARTSSSVIMACWLILFGLETVKDGFGNFGGAESYAQAAAIALIFAGYVIGWKIESAGGLMAICGTVALFVIVVMTIDYPLDSTALWFAAPGLLYLLAASYADRRNERV
jgi:hypothetical protein